MSNKPQVHNNRPQSEPYTITQDQMKASKERREKQRKANKQK